MSTTGLKLARVAEWIRRRSSNPFYAGSIPAPGAPQDKTKEIMWYYNNSFIGHWVGGVAIVYTDEGRAKAADILQARLKKDKIPGTVHFSDMISFEASSDTVIILSNGDY